MHENPDYRLVPCNLNGTEGHGVDFILELPDGRHRAYQSKSDKKVAQLKVVENWIDQFLVGKYFNNSAEFIILSAYPVSPKIYSRVQERSRELEDQVGLRVTIEGPNWFHYLFMKHTQIVEKYFGAEATADFQNRRMLFDTQNESSWRKKTSTDEFRPNGNSLICHSSGIRINAILPGEMNADVSALFVFTEPGLYDALITFGNDSLIKVFDDESWLHGVPFGGIPSGESFFLQLGNVRLCLSNSMCRDLGDDIRRIAAAWHESVKLIGLKRETSGYALSSLHDGVVLGKIHIDAWRLIVEFAREHQHDQGDSPWHIFLESNTAVNIFTRGNSDMRTGFHLSLETQPAVIRGRQASESWLELIWKFPPNALNCSDDFSRSAWWPAHTSCVWLVEELLPAAFEWSQVDDRTRLQKLFRRPRARVSFSLESWWYSRRAKFLNQCRPHDRIGLAELVEALQRNYALRRSSIFPSSFMAAIDSSLLRLIERADLESWDYLRSKANLKETEPKGIVAELRARVERDEYVTSGNFAIEWHLRSLMELLRASSGPIDVSDIEVILRDLSTLCLSADRDNERLANLYVPSSIFPR